MPFIPAPNVAQINMRYLQSGQPVENVYHVLCDDGVNAVILGNLANAFATWEIDGAKSDRHTETFLTSIYCRDLTTEGGDELIYTEGLPIQGTDESGPLPNNVTIAIKAQTGLAGRSNRGRTYWIGLPKDEVTDQQITTSSASNLTSDMSDLLNAINGADPSHHLCVLSAQLDGVPRNPRVPVPIINYVLTDLTCDSQRRRLPAHNSHR